MTNNFEQIPGILFDLINQFSFEELSAEQQANVQVWFEPSEYNELHEIAKIAQDSKPNTPSRKGVIKQNLLNQFETKNKSKKPWYQAEITLWKIAAMFLLANILMFIGYRFSSNKQQIVFPQIATIDTVFVEREKQITHATIYDTIYFKVREMVKKKDNNFVDVGSKGLGKISLSELNNIRVQDMNQIDAVPNQIRGNNIKNDTLLNTFTIVRL